MAMLNGKQRFLGRPRPLGKFRPLGQLRLLGKLRLLGRPRPLGKLRFLARAGLVSVLLQAHSAPLLAEEPAAVTPDAIETLVAENSGKVVVVNFWATWCPPCLREFPDIIEIYSDYREQGLSVLAVSMNDAEEVEDIEQFVADFDPPFPVYRAASVDAEFFEGVLDSWFGEMPMTLVYDTAGELVHVHKKPMTYEELSADVEALLE
jgi:thiol-disulfide isomerase/thioredoxin